MSQERFTEIEHAIQNIERNLLLLLTDASPEQAHFVMKADTSIREYRGDLITPAKEAFNV